MGDREPDEHEPSTQGRISGTLRLCPRTSTSDRKRKASQGKRSGCASAKLELHEFRSHLAAGSRFPETEASFVVGAGGPPDLGIVRRRGDDLDISDFRGHARSDDPGRKHGRGDSRHWRARLPGGARMHPGALGHHREHDRKERTSSKGGRRRGSGRRRCHNHNVVHRHPHRPRLVGQSQCPPSAGLDGPARSDRPPRGNELVFPQALLGWLDFHAQPKEKGTAGEREEGGDFLGEVVLGAWAARLCLVLSRRLRSGVVSPELLSEARKSDGLSGRARRCIFFGHRGRPNVHGASQVAVPKNARTYRHLARGGPPRHGGRTGPGNATGSLDPDHDDSLAGTLFAGLVGTLVLSLPHRGDPDRTGHRRRSGDRIILPRQEARSCRRPCTLT